MMAKFILKYSLFFLYSYFFCIASLLLIGLAISGVYYFSNGIFDFSFSQVKRALFFGFIGGSGISLGTVLFNTIDWYNARKKPPTDPDK